MQTLAQLRSGALTGAVRLQLSCGLTEFPDEIFDLADTLEILDLSGNALSTLPDQLPRLTRLRVLFCSMNQFTVLPAILGACPNLTMIGFKSNRIHTVPASALPPTLRWLILTDNAIDTLPDTIGRCTQLEKLMLAGNALRALPDALAGCTELALLRIAANRMPALPAWLLTMPRLAWLGFAGNPAGNPNGNPVNAAYEVAATAAAHPSIRWRDLTLAHQLGEGASGVISQAVLHAPDGAAVAVAVKLFKGAITSDGLPACELAACLGAGRHPNLIPVLGEVRDHPDGVHGCVMTLIDPAYRTLAGPPSLASCTRDVYASDLRFSLDAVLQLARAIAAAARHLHARGILHGDLYAHNILHTTSGDALLGDFGAASLFDPDAPQAPALQRLEVRAFGLLLEELLARCDTQAAFSVSIARLTHLQAACTQVAIAERPLFDAIVRHLEQVSTDTAGIIDQGA